MKKLSYLLILVGAALILFPIAKQYYYEWEQNELLEGYEEHQAGTVQEQYQYLANLFEEEDRLQATDASASDRSSAAAVILSEAGGTDADASGQDEPPASAPPESPAAPAKQEDQAIAVITIDKINLKLPVLEGATQSNLRYAAAHLTGTANLGENGNAAIAAHRSRKKGRLFNRLNELEEGDVVKINMKGEVVEYTVFRTTRVKPTDISVLSSNDKEAVLTLITCDPLVNPTHRLIVQAKKS